MLPTSGCWAANKRAKRKGASLIRVRPDETLIEPEIDLDAHHDGDRRPAILHCRLEFVLPDSLEGLFIQPHAQRARNPGILWISLCIDDERNNADSLILGAPRFVGEFSLGRENRHRSRHATAYLVDAPAGIASGPGSIAVAVPRAETATVAAAHTATATRAIGGQLDIRGVLDAKIRQVWII